MALTKIGYTLIKDNFKDSVSGSSTAHSSSFSTRVTTLETSGSITESSASFSTRVATLETSGSITESSASFSTRVTTEEGNVDSLQTDSGSFSTRVTTAEASGALFDGTGAVTFATVDTGQGANELYDMDQNVKTDSNVTFGNVTATGTVTAEEFHTEFVSASIAYVSGSTKFGDTSDDIHSFTGSIHLTNSGSVSGSIFSTGSFGAIYAGGMTVPNLINVSSSLSTRVSDLVTDSGSFSTRITDSNLYLSGSGTIISGSSTSTGSFGKLAIGGAPQTHKVWITENSTYSCLGMYNSNSRGNLLIGDLNSTNAADFLLRLRGDDGNNEVVRVMADGTNQLFTITGNKISGSAASTGSFGQIFLGDVEGNSSGYDLKIRSGLCKVGIHTSSGTGKPTLEFGNAGGQYASIVSTGEVPLHISTNSSGPGNNIRMTVSSSGVGIGTATPQAYLDVRAPSGVTTPTVMYWKSDQHGLGLQSVVGSTYTTLDQFGSTYYLALQSNGGNIGIGTTAPLRQVTLYKASNPEIQFINSGTGVTAGDGTILQQGGDIFYIYNQEAGSIIFGTSDTQRMELTAGGALQLGDFDSSSHFQVKANYANEHLVKIWADGDDANRYGMIVKCGEDSGQGELITFQDGNGDGVGSITFSGSTVAYGTFTANHEASLPTEDADSKYPYGTLVEIVSLYYKQKNGADSERGIRYNVKKTSSPYSKKVLGSYSDYMKSNPEGEANLHKVDILGDGHILCNGEKGNIEIGDGICSSSSEGEGMKADKMCMIMGIAQEDVSFSGSESKLVAVQYGLQQFTPWENA